MTLQVLRVCVASFNSLAVCANYIIYKKEDFSVDLNGFVHMHRCLQGHKNTVLLYRPMSCNVIQVNNGGTHKKYCSYYMYYIIHIPFQLVCTAIIIRYMSRVKTTDLE